MATGGCTGVEGGGGRVGVGSQKRVASSERPEVSEVAGENTLRKTGNPEEFVVFKVKGDCFGESDR